MLKYLDNNINKISLFFALLLIASGCTATYDLSYSYEIYEFEKDDYPKERQKLASVIEETLLKHKLYIEDRENTDVPGKEGTIETQWNDEQARNTLSSHEGYRLKAHVIITENTEQFDKQTDDPVMNRYLESVKNQRKDVVRVALGLAIEKEKNTAIPKFAGDLKEAKWKPVGMDELLAARLHYEIRKAFNKIAKKPSKEQPAGSEITRNIIEKRYSSSKKNDNAKPKKEKDTKDLYRFDGK